MEEVFKIALSDWADCFNGANGALLNARDVFTAYCVIDKNGLQFRVMENRCSGCLALIDFRGESA